MLDCKSGYHYLDKTFVYEYNNIGNIVSVTTTPTGGTATTVSYTYDSKHPDRLKYFGSEDIGYSKTGGIDSYNSRIYEWDRGKLAGFSRGSIYQSGSVYEECVYTYNAFGQRISKEHIYDRNPAVPNDTSYNYTTTYKYDHSGRLINEYTAETHNINGDSTKEFKYLYDESGIVGCIYTKNGIANTYYYQRNLFGDVIGIYNTSGTKIVEYGYDAWGNCTVISGTSYAIANDNPIRYRGYYFDSETQWYFLNARYYSPEFRRFISPDDTAYLDPENVNGLNLYCYCGNDPVNFADSSGHFPFYIVATVVVISFGIWGGIQGASLSERVEGNMNTNLPGNINNSNKYYEFSDLDRAVNTAMGTLAFAHSGAVLVAGLGAVITFINPVIGAPIFALGAIYSIVLSLLLIPFGIEMKNPELDPSDIPKVNLPTFK